MTDGTRAAWFVGALVLAFAAGAFSTAVVVWHRGNIIGSPGRAEANTPTDPIHRWGSREPEVTVRPHDGLNPSGTSGALATPHDPADEDIPSLVAIPPARPTPTIGANPLAALKNRVLEVPVSGVRRETLRSSFEEARNGRQHEAMDILAPRNTPVVAVEPGRIAKLFTSRAGGLTIYQFDAGEEFAYYYAHLERYADGLEEGDHVRRGQVIGYVGTSGNAPPNTPHLHFAIFRLDAQKRWWQGQPIDPFLVLR